MVPGKSPQYIAKAAGFDIPEDVTHPRRRVQGEVGENEPLTMEKLPAPVAVLKSEKQGTGLRCAKPCSSMVQATPRLIHTNDQARYNAASVYACCII